MDRDEDDDIATPDTSRSNSIDGDDERPSVSPPPPPSTEQIIPSETSPTKETSTDIAEQIKTTVAAKQATFLSDSTSSSESETDFVALNKNDFEPDGSSTFNIVSLLTGCYAQLIALCDDARNNCK